MRSSRKDKMEEKLGKEKVLEYQIEIAVGDRRSEEKVQGVYISILSIFLLTIDAIHKLSSKKIAGGLYCNSK